MGFRYVEPDPPEPQPAIRVWMAFVGVGLVALVVLLPIALPILFAALTLGERLNDRGEAQTVEALEPEVSTADDAYRERRHTVDLTRPESPRAERTVLEWVRERDRAVACEELRAQFIASGVEMSEPLQPCSVPTHSCAEQLDAAP
jgi:hypothetical protein